MTAFYQRRDAGHVTVRRVEVYGHTGSSRATRYDPADVQREAARLGIQPRTPPRGTLSTTQLTTITGVSRRVIALWVRHGCPASQTPDRKLHLHPDGSHPQLRRLRGRIEELVHELEAHQLSAVRVASVRERVEEARRWAAAALAQADAGGEG